MKIHIVQKGDTLWKIAQKYGVDFEELKQLNSQLSNPDMIMPGMKIKVPSAGVPVKKKESPIIKEAPVKEPYVDLSPEPLPVVKEQVKAEVAKEKPKMPYAPKIPQLPELEMDINNYYLNMAYQNAPETTNVFPGMVPKQPTAVSPAQDEAKEVPKAPQLSPEAVSPLNAPYPENCVPITGINPGYGFNYNPYGPGPQFGQPGFPQPGYPSMVSPVASPELDDLDDMPEMPQYPGPQQGGYAPGPYPQQLPYAGGNDCGCGGGAPHGALPYPGAEPGYGAPGYPGAQPGFGGPGYPGAQPGFGGPGYPGAQPGFGGPDYPGVTQPGYGVPGYPDAGPGVDPDEEEYEVPGYQPGFGAPGFPAGSQPGYGAVPGFPAGAQPGYGAGPGYPAGSQPGYGAVSGFPAGAQPGYGAGPGYPAGAQPGYGAGPGYPAGAQPGYGAAPGFPAGAQPGYGAAPGFPAGAQPGYGAPGFPQQGPLGMPDFDDDDDFNL